MLIFEIVDWFLLVFLIFGRELRSLISTFWTFIHSIKTFSFSSFILSSSGWDCGQCLIPRHFDHFEHYCQFVQDLIEFIGKKYLVIQHPHAAVLYDVDQNGNCYYWPLHLVIDFHISIVSSILFRRCPYQKDICFL